MKRFLFWLLNNFPAVVAFGLTVCAFLAGDDEYERFFLLLFVLFGISHQVSELRNEVRRTNTEEAKRLAREMQASR